MTTVATKNLSTEQMTKISQANDNEYVLFYHPFHGVVMGLRAMFAMSNLKYKFTHPIVRSFIPPSSITLQRITLS